MAIDDVTMTDLIEAAIEDFARERLWTSLIGVVQSFDPEKSSVNVQPAILEKNPLDPEGEGERIPLLVNVPVEFPRWGGFEIETPVVPGDVVMVTILRQPYDQWLLKGGVDVLEPFNVQYDLSQAVARPGPRPFNTDRPAVSTTDLVIRAVDGSTSITLKPGGGVEIEGATEVKIGAGATKPAANGTDNDANWSALQAWFIANAAAFALAGITLGPVWPPPTPGLPPAGAPAPTSVNKTKVE